MFGMTIHLHGTPLPSRSGCLVGPIRLGGETSGERRPRNHADSKILQKGDHFPFLFAIDRGMEVLHGDELRQAMGLGVVLHLMDCECGQTGGIEECLVHLHCQA